MLAKLYMTVELVSARAERIVVVQHHRARYVGLRR